MTVEGFLKRNELRLAGILGVVGMALGVLADLASGYSLDGTTVITTAFSVLSLENLSVFLLSKPTSQVVLGHYLAILGIPLGLFGFWQVYQAIKPAGWGLSRNVWYLGVFAYVAGTVFHSTFAFITFGVQAADTAPPAAEPAMQTMFDNFELVFEPLGVLLVGAMAVALAFIFYAIAFKQTHYPRWFALANPLVIQAVTGLLALISPLELRIFFIVTAYNLSLLVFYAVSTALLWNSPVVAPRGNEGT
ncbi:DUF6796 family protein [Haloferax chudinovii]|uniref:DUF6796 family protein n=1 Tax=Haloferax chudinovii TaxID=1109010 RepID=A0ABD5XMY3_9EURY